MSALAKTSTANAQATQHRTSPFSTASPSTCSNRTKPANAESTENASRPVGTMTTYFNSSDIKMRLPCWGYQGRAQTSRLYPRTQKFECHRETFQALARSSPARTSVRIHAACPQRQPQHAQQPVKPLASKVP